MTDGMPTPQSPLDRASAEFAIQALKVLAGLSAEERRRPQTGTFRSRDAEGTATTWTVRTSGSVAGERVMLAANERGHQPLRHRRAADEAKDGGVEPDVVVGQAQRLVAGNRIQNLRSEDELVFMQTKRLAIEPHKPQGD